MTLLLVAAAGCTPDPTCTTCTTSTTTETTTVTTLTTSTTTVSTSTTGTTTVQTSGWTPLTSPASASQAIATYTAPDSGDGPSRHISHLGDVDDDGYGDLMVGNAYADGLFGGESAGVVFLSYGEAAPNAGAVYLHYGDATRKSGIVVASAAATTRTSAKRALHRAGSPAPR